MPVTVLIGAQWGDEGKGKITDALSREAHYVVMFNGGSNAGHTVVVEHSEGAENYAFRLLPSGVLTPGVTPVLAHGVVIDLEVLCSELDDLERRGLDASSLRVSNNAHVVGSYHRTIDAANERMLGVRQLGTTQNGIGPAYADKMNRVGFRVQDLFDSARLRDKVVAAVRGKNEVLAALPGFVPIDVEAVTAALARGAERLRPMVCDTTELLQDAIDEGKDVLCEAGQATLLDIDHGTYPFVTPSSTTAAGACVGTGIPPTRVDRVVAVAKSYTTRVGGGPFPTEASLEDADMLRARGNEYGVVTSRPRRCGWFDAVACRFAARLNGVTEFAITKLDVLSGLAEIPICVSYDVDGVLTSKMPSDQGAISRARPVYTVLPGWVEDISSCRHFADLPLNCKRLVEFVEERVGVPVSLIGLGPGREAVIRI